LQYKTTLPKLPNKDNDSKKGQREVWTGKKGLRNIKEKKYILNNGLLEQTLTQ
jgi:hypothetical protein